MNLPEAFIEDIRPFLPAEELNLFCQSLTESEASTCIRWNARKQGRMDGGNDWMSADDAAKLHDSDCMGADDTARSIEASPIPWNTDSGQYLSQRPQFTLDPRLHAGAYYVQEAASQFVTHVLRSLLGNEPLTMLDLCAAPGGKSTAALSVLPEGSRLVSNEIDHRRARILSENVTKWGAPNVIVTGNAPADFTGLTHLFDVILTDVPCSGEGMFRKDEGAVSDWSPSKVEGCVKLQRDILQDIWPTLKPGGILIYSTCTFNVHEDEEQLQYICEELGAEPLVIPIEEGWHIHPPLMGDIPCYRFMPHYTKGEGLFMAALRKLDDNLSPIDYQRRSKAKDKKSGKAKALANGRNASTGMKSNALPDLKKLAESVKPWTCCEGKVEVSGDGTLRLIPTPMQDLHDTIVAQGLYLLQSGIELGSIKGRDIIPAHALALSQKLNPEAFPMVEIDKELALNYLRREAIVLPADAPTGYVLVCYRNLPLGFVKNMGNRSNNLYPQEWRIRFS